MIAHLKGQLVELELSSAVIDVGGVGYYVDIPMSTYDRLPKVGSPVALRIHMVVREDAMSLYGFATDDERSFFKMITSVSGIGPKLALAALSAFPIETFCEAIQEGNVKILSKVSGVGKRMAERMVVELRDKVSALGLTSAMVARIADDDMSAQDKEAFNDAIMALEALGYRPDMIRKTVKSIFDSLTVEQRNSENIIKAALSALNS
ncbi:Holliday junction branch migration protein RuvA [Lentisphaera profundi]|uniref:Holliday junction branch migration complex subunit RuvA n=1 Tax=Lentisphaera profundi TaxID=1658616 RepID=A0ABY7VVI3_9BACT|nr:Holliday junction branch migration protein RuvA [Lentisphaera profundi]WDE98241.1 Holliday junction branch migration protein RuvA [Lentisphaera profundi]